MGRGRVSGRGVAGGGREAGASPASGWGHPYLAAVQANFERTIPLNYSMNGFVDGTYQKLTHAQIVEKATRMVEENLPPEVLTMLQSQNVKIVMEHASNKTHLDPQAHGHWSAQHNEIVMRDIETPSTLRHEAGHALSSNIRARQQHFEYESRGHSLHSDVAFVKAVKADLDRIRTKGTDAEKDFAFKKSEYYTSSVNSITGDTNNRRQEMFAETYSAITAPSGAKWAQDRAQKWKEAFPETTKAMEKIIKNITEVPLHADGQPRRFGTEKATY